VIEMSKEAEEMINEMIVEQGDSSLFLRVGVEDGGCSGLSYSIKLDEELTEDDEVINEGRFKVVWNKRSEPFLSGVIIGYQHQGMTGGFTIDNPNAKATCGCGASFRTATYRGERKKCD